MEVGGLVQVVTNLLHSSREIMMVQLQWPEINNSPIEANILLSDGIGLEIWLNKMS